MVAAGVGTTLLPRLAVSPPSRNPDGVVLREFVGAAPHRDIAMVWRRSSVQAPLLDEVAEVLGRLPAGLVTPL